MSQKPRRILRVRSSWEDNRAEYRDWHGNASANNEKPSPSCKASYTIEVGVARRLEIAGKHGTQWPRDVEEGEPARDLSPLVPTSDAVNDTRISYALEQSAEESDDINVFDILGKCGQECENPPDELEGWN